MRNLLILLAAVTLSACASLQVQTTPQWDSHFGADVRATLAQQILYPAAGSNSDPASGMDGRSARAAYERYLKNAGEPAAQAPVLNGGAK